LANEAKREAQEALFTAIKDQAETNMKAALRAPEKARLLRELAEAYRLTAGGTIPDMARSGKPAGNTAGSRPPSAPSDDGEPKQAPAR